MGKYGNTIGRGGKESRASVLYIAKSGGGSL